MRASRFLKITPKESGALVEIIHPDTQQVERFFLRKKGETAQITGCKTIDVPVKRMIVLSSPYIGMLGKLNATDKITATTSQEYIYNKHVLAGIKSGKIRALHDAFQASTEVILGRKAEVLMFSAFSTEFPKQKLIEQNGTECIPCYDWRETDPLGKAEWIKLFGYLVGKEQQAFSYFDRIQASYSSLKKTVTKKQKSLRVFCGNLMGDAWFSPAGGSFFASQIKDAGGKYAFSHTSGTGSHSVTFEHILSTQRGADIWLDPGVPDINVLLRNQPKMSYFSCVKNKEVYCYSHQMNKYWELSAIEPDRFLSDLIHILSGKGKEEKEMYFYRNIAR
jgi:iron complex transport system substrate-binding protein